MYSSIAVSQTVVTDIYMGSNVPNLKVINSFSKSIQLNNSEANWSIASDSIFVELDSFATSNTLFNFGFNFNIKNIELVKSIRCIVKGYSLGEGEIKDVTLELVDSSIVISSNLANKYYQGKSWDKGELSTWKYYMNIDRSDFNRVNSRNFGLRLAVRNNSSKSVKAIIKDILIEIEYKPYYSICSDKRFSVRVDNFGEGYNYKWKLPERCNITSNPNSRLVSLKFGEGNYGLDTISIVADNGAIKYIGQKEIFHKDCRVSSIVGKLKFKENCKSDSIIRVNRNFNPIVSLIANGNKIDYFVTDSDGVFRFDNIDAGKYLLIIEGGDGFFINKNSNYLGEFTFNSEGDFYESDVFEVLPDQTIDSLYCEFIRFKELQVNTWNDVNGDNIFADNEKLFADNLPLILGSNNSISPNIDSEGRYNYSDLIVGKNRLCLDSNDSLYFSSSLDNCIDFEVNCIDSLVDMTLGIYKSAKISGVVWIDENENGIRELNDNLLRKVKIDLRDSDGKLLNTTLSDSLGKYKFNNLRIGDYMLTVDIPSKYLLTKYNMGNASADNDFKEDARTSIIKIKGGDIIDDIDCGLVYRRGSIGDFVWFDTNENGLQDIGENGINGIKVNLLDVDGLVLDSIYSYSKNGYPGFYSFKEVPKGEYFIAVDLPKEYKLTDIIISLNDSNSDIFSVSNKSSLIVLDAGENYTNIDIGLVHNYGAIQCDIWFDANYDGIKEDNEIGIEDVEIELYNENNDLLFSKVSLSNDISSNVLFDSLVTDDYYLVANWSDEKYVLTKFQSGEDRSKDSDFSLNKGVNLTDMIKVNPGEIIDNYDLGLALNYGQISGFVWNDINENGIKEIGENYIDSVRIELYSNDLRLVGTTFTGLEENGKYKFRNIEKGAYIVKFINPENFDISEGIGDDMKISNRFGIGTTDLINLNWGAQVGNINGGFISDKGIIGDYIWLDKNDNGIQDIDEIGLGAIRIELFDENKNKLLETISDDDGRYIFKDIIYGKYFISFEISDEYLISNNGVFETSVGQIKLINNHAVTEIFELHRSEEKLDLDLGLVYNYSVLGDKVWLDNNGNGREDFNENGVAGIELTIFDENHNKKSEIVTDEGGNYQFENLRSGKYYIEVKLPKKYIVKGSAKYPITNKFGQNTTELFEILPGQNLLDADFCLNFIKAKIGDFVWFDDNENGVFDEGEKGLNGIEVVLRGIENNEVYKTKTSNNGNEPGYYLFEVDEGNYYLNFNSNNNYIKTKYNSSGGLCSVSDIKVVNSRPTEFFEVKYGEEKLNIDIPFVYKRGSVGGRVWLDSGVLGQLEENEKGINGIGIELYNEDGDVIMKMVSKTRIDKKGFYSFVDVLPGDYYIRFDLPEGFQQTIAKSNIGAKYNSNITGKYGDGTTDLFRIYPESNTMYINGGFTSIPNNLVGDFVWLDKNEDGYQDIDEEGVNDVEVQLFTKDSIFVRETITKNNPNTGLPGYYAFEGVNSGEYYLKFVIHPEYKFSYNNESVNKENDSDIISPFGTTDIFIIKDYEINTSIDAGLIPANCAVGDFIWEDMNWNGIQDIGEPGVNGVGVRLYKILPNNKRRFVKEVVTRNNAFGEAGVFLITQLSSGDYYYELDVPDSYYITKPFQGGDIRLDSDINDNNGSGIGVNSTDTIHLEINDRNYHVDAGLIRFSSVEGIVWEDSNEDGIRDEYEKGIEKVQIELRDVNSNNIFYSVSDKSGIYKIVGNIAPGKYYIAIDKTANTFTKQGSGSGNSVINPNTGRSNVFNVLSGSKLKGFDIGIINSGSTKLSTYPNPAKDFVNVIFTNKQNCKSELIMTNLDGITLKTLEFETVEGLNILNMDIHDLKSGDYYLYLLMENKVIDRKLIIKAK